MTLAITAFRIAGLHDHRNVSINIEDNCVVLVGVNGLGKTTIINILYYLLTRQWGRLIEYKFDALAIDIGGETLSVTRAQLEAPVQSNRFRARVARRDPRLAALFNSNPEVLRILATMPDDPILLRSLSEQFHVSYVALREARLFFDDEPLQQELFASSDELKRVEEQLASHIAGQVLYLPTYRRIERDLEKLFPGLDEQVQRQRAHRTVRPSAFLEFVEFGMTDVERRFAEVLTNLKERARSELNSLAASYLGEVIRGEADTYDTTLIASLDTETITRILSRIEERNILDAPDRQLLRTVIAKLQGSSAEITAQEKYVGHFFSKLAAIHRSLAEAEAAVDAFVRVCNGYLVGKQVLFDDRKYTISVQPKVPDSPPLELRHLSSGEKQIVSLFTHVYLGNSSEFVVLIDEPELSLSVPWQRKLLSDIRSSGRCSFLAAVTHSPFIYENELRERATDLQGCISEQ